MSPKFNKAQSLGRVRIETCSKAIWHSALKRGVVVRSQNSLPRPLIFKFISHTNKTIGAAQTCKLCQLDHINERELPIKLTPHSP